MRGSIEGHPTWEVKSDLNGLCVKGTPRSSSHSAAGGGGFSLSFNRREENNGLDLRPCYYQFLLPHRASPWRERGQSAVMGHVGHIGADPLNT